LGKKDGLTRAICRPPKTPGGAFSAGQNKNAKTENIGAMFFPS